MDDFQSFGGYFPSKPDFTPPYPPISGHSVIAPSKFSLNTVSLCIDRRYWSFGYYHDWWVLYDCAKMMGGYSFIVAISGRSLAIVNAIINPQNRQRKDRDSTQTDCSTHEE